MLPRWSYHKSHGTSSRNSSCASSIPFDSSQVIRSISNTIFLNGTRSTFEGCHKKLPSQQAYCWWKELNLDCFHKHNNQGRRSIFVSYKDTVVSLVGYNPYWMIHRSSLRALFAVATFSHTASFPCSNKVTMPTRKTFQLTQRELSYTIH